MLEGMTLRNLRRWGSGENSFAAPPKVSGALLAHFVDELNHLYGGLIVLVSHWHKFLVLAVGQAIEGRLVLGRRLHERFRDGLLEIGRQIGEVGVGRAGQQSGLED